MYYALICGFSAASAVLLTVMGFKIMQILQLSSYRVRGLFEWLKSTKADYVIRYFSVAFFSVVCMLVYTGCFGAVKCDLKRAETRDRRRAFFVVKCV